MPPQAHPKNVYAHSSGQATIATKAKNKHRRGGDRKWEHRADSMCPVGHGAPTPMIQARIVITGEAGIKEGKDHDPRRRKD